MVIFSSHTREIQSTTKDASMLIDTICNKKATLWPSTLWPRDNFTNEKPLISTEGGHGGTRYIVSDYKPGKLIKFEFTYPSNYRGFHQFSIKKVNEGRVILSHLTHIDTSLSRFLLWQLMIRWVHDALITDAFDQAESHLTSRIVSSKWHWHVYVIRHTLGGSRLLTQWIKSLFTAERSSK